MADFRITMNNRTEKLIKIISQSKPTLQNRIRYHVAEISQEKRGKAKKAANLNECD
jgi:hypothetical protein